MKLKQISQWISYEAMNAQLKSKIIKSWLLEEGPITKRIESNEKFELKLLRDDLGNVNKLDRSFLGHLNGDMKKPHTKNIIFLLLEIKKKISY